MERKFGALFRAERKAARKTLGEVADALGLSVSYIADIEHGRRQPLPQDRLAKLASMFAASSVERLMAIAAECRAAFQLTGYSPKAVTVGAVLERRWSGLTEGQLEEIKKIALNGQINPDDDVADASVVQQDLFAGGDTPT